MQKTSKHETSKSSVTSVITLDSITPKFNVNNLYELRRQHPIVDSVEMSNDVYHIKKNYSCHHAASDLPQTVIFLESMYVLHYY